MTITSLKDFLGDGYIGFTGSRGVTSTPFIVTSNYTAADQDFIIADTTSNSFTITLPEDPSTGSGIKIAAISASINNLTLNGNSNTFEDLESELVIDIDNVALEIIYSGTTWQVYVNVGPNGETGPQGEIGFTGSQGDIGFTGSQGEIGFIGSQGFTGSQGDIGFTGSQGDIVTNIPPSTNTTIVSSDKGKYLNVTSNVTINDDTGFVSGDAVTIYNNTADDIDLIATGVTLRLAGTDETGDRVIAERGLVTILCVGTNDYVVSGAGIS